jgi:hypothetical protein
MCRSNSIYDTGRGYRTLSVLQRDKVWCRKSVPTGRYHWKDLHWGALERQLEIGSFTNTRQGFTKSLKGNLNAEAFKGRQTNI